MIDTVACVLRSGGPYTTDHVHALRAGLAEYAPGAELVCLTDLTRVGTTRIPLLHEWPGWWSKLELFRPGIFARPVLYLDLDTLITGNLDDIRSYSGAFAMLNDFYQGRRLAASGVMAWTPGPHTTRIYEALAKRGTVPGGRSDYFYKSAGIQADRLQDLYPGQIVSFKAHARSSLPEGARLVCFHGRPRPQDRAAGWAGRKWMEYVAAAASEPITEE